MVISDDSLLVFFADNTSRKIPFEKLYNIDGAEKLMNNAQLLESGRVGAGGYYVTFNNSIDIPAAELYKTGTKLPLTMSDFNNYVRKNILDTSEVCSMLECSRQNLAYLLNKDLLKPIKEDVKGNLYQKGDVLKM